MTPTSDERTIRRRRFKTIVKIVVTLALCGTLYGAADWRAVANQLSTLDRRLLLAALLLFVPQTLVSAWRWQRVIRPWARLTLADATAHTLIGSAWNLIVPSKLGDFSKAALAPATETDADSRKRIAGCVAAEKVADLAALAIATFVGLQLRGPEAIAFLLVLLSAVFLLQRRLRVRGLRFDLIACAAGTAVLWTLHLTQVHWFLRAAGVEVSFATSLVRVPAALLAGIVPAAFCGIGTRDAALVWLFADVATPATMAAVGLLTALRYVVPGAAGIPLLWLQKQSARPTHPGDRSANRHRSAPVVANSATA